jgi:hypothetical protein
MAREGLRPDLHSDGVKAFIAECQEEKCTIITIAGYIWALWKVATVVRPSTRDSLGWLLTTCRNIEAIATTSQKTGAHRKVDSAELALAGERLIAEAREVVGIKTDDLAELVRLALRAGPASALPGATWRAIQLFRDGLFLLVGAYAPERRRALTTISIDQINLRDGIIEFEPAQIKTKRASPRPLPPTSSTTSLNG